MSNPVKIVAVLAPRPGKTEELQVLLEGLAAASRTEPGNLRWDVWQEQGADKRFVLDELYTDNAAAIAHRETPHFQDYLKRVGGLAERSALTLDPFNLGQV
ncbi:putative quinol monooxygenase [Bosea sp. BK604]|uniref:putative quinol monooxygenase n=1 Tax=Bosea sp. BK604 TaxID=2512180 RepID=UPI00104A418A|nr:putative quinol monooxygenase [Bosea sp. BK604]TCR62541.1 quinol monooxygenase YgiN [Bosea sp. BK604]